MYLNFDKTVYMCISEVKNKVKSDIKLHHGIVKYTSGTIYLGTSITDCGSIRASIENDMKT